MAKEKKQSQPEEDPGAVKTPRPPQHIDPSSPPGKGRNKEDDKRGDLGEGSKRSKKDE